jgi:hypothetical protein
MDPAKLRVWSILVHVAAVAAGVGLAMFLFDRFA